METKANYVVVGVFTLCAIVAAFAFVYWTAAVGDRGETALLRIRIPGSASGLGRGSAVNFNGVKVGDVTRVYIDVSNPTAAIADAVIDRLTPITASTKADIGLAGLTGQANIELKGADPAEPKLFDLAEETDTVAEITANPSAVTNLLQTAQDIFTKTETVLAELQTFTRDVREPLTQTMRNTEKFSQALADNSEGVDRFLESVTSVANELKGVSGKLDGTLKAAEDILNAVDRDKIRTIVTNVETFSKGLSDQAERLDTIVGKVDTAVTSINEFVGQGRATLGKVDGVLEGVDPDTVRRSLASIESATADARRAAGEIARFTDTVGKRTEDVDRIIADAREISGRLNAASVRVDGIMAKVDQLLGSGEAEGVMADASETLKAFRQVADTLNARLGAITDGLARFSGKGLRDVEALVNDSRRSIQRIEQAVSDLERNPQRIITGGAGTVREYDGRTRR